jgi:hypothetical protein
MYYTEKFYKEEKQSDLFEALEICNQALRTCEELDEAQYGPTKHYLKSLLYFQYAF